MSNPLQAGLSEALGHVDEIQALKVKIERKQKTITAMCKDRDKLRTLLSQLNEIACKDVEHYACSNLEIEVESALSVKENNE